MARTLEQVDWFEEIVSYYISDKPGHKIWFTRKMNQLSQNEQEKIWAILRARGYEKAEEESEDSDHKRNFVSWSSEEWDDLANLVWNARKDDPTETLIGLVKKVMDEFPEDRRRTIRVLNDIKPLVERLKFRDESLSSVEYPEDEILPSTREEVLRSLNDEEIIRYFGAKVLALYSPDEIFGHIDSEIVLSNIPIKDIASYLFQQGFDALMGSQKELAQSVRQLNKTIQHQGIGNKPNIPMPNPVPMKLPKVTIIGLLGAQQNTLEKRLEGRANFNFVDKNRRVDAIPTGQDFVVVAANFVSHVIFNAAQKAVEGTDAKLIVHHGGISTLVQKLDDILPEAIFA